MLFHHLLGMGYYQGHHHGENGCLADQAIVLEEAIQQAQGQKVVFRIYWLLILL